MSIYLNQRIEAPIATEQNSASDFIEKPVAKSLDKNPEAQDPGADFFKPTAGYNNGNWGFWMPVRFLARYVSAEVLYSFDGLYYERAHMKTQFSTTEKPQSNKVYIKIEKSADDVIGPYEYDFDFSALRTEYLVKDRLSRGNGISKVISPVNKGPDTFPLIINYEYTSGRDNMLTFQAVVEDTVSRYQIKLEGHNTEYFNATKDENFSIGLFSSSAIQFAPNQNFSISVISDKGKFIGPSFYKIDLPALIKSAWKKTFDENEAIECEYDRYKESKNPGTSVRCFAYGRSYSGNWAGIAKVDVGPSPSLMKTKIVAASDEDLVRQVRVAGGQFESMRSLQYSACAASDRKEICFFEEQFPSDTEQVYARFYYYDGQISDIRRFEVKNRP